MMVANRRTPRFDKRFPELDRFIIYLEDLYNAGKLNSWGELEASVKEFFTPARMQEMESAVPGWCEMTSYTDGITLIHIMCVFLGMYMLPEFQSLIPEQQDLMKWVILFHDSAKIHLRGKKDTMHAFHSAVLTAKALPHLGFPVTEKYSERIDAWSEYTNQAYITRADDSALIPDNHKLQRILAGIQQLYGPNTTADLVVKTVLLHISLKVDVMYPTPAPMTDEEAKRIIDSNVFPLLRVMMLSDNEGWSLFEPETRARQRRDTLAVFEHVKMLIL